MSFEHHDPQYHKFKVHDLMLSDVVRTETYKRAIEENVGKGSTVIDFGAGTGILSIFAAKAGARKVYSIERTPIINLAKKLARDNGVNEIIEFIEADAKDIHLPEKVDAIISEWLGVFVFQENMLPNLLLLRDKYLKKGGKLLPEKVNLYLALINAPGDYRGTVGKWKENMYGLNFNRLAAQQSKKEHLIDLKTEEIISEVLEVFKLDLYRCIYSNKPEYHAKLGFRTTQKARCDGLGGWFKAYFPGMEVLDTEPGKPVTCWQQTYFPFETPVELGKGRDVTIDFSIVIDSKDSRRALFEWRII